jgi:formylglycine-generating enzyme required for sulfatase activity
MELIQALWPDAVVGDDALPHCIMEVRKALGEDGHRLIKTVPARGYLFERDLPKPPRRIPHQWAGVAVLLIAGVGSVAVWRFVRSQRALAELPVIEELAAKGRYFEAWDRASQLPGHHQRLTALMPVISDDLSVTTSPPGAQVHLTRFGSGVRTLAGATPLRHLKIARGEYVISLEKPGLAPFERTISSALSRTEDPALLGWNITVEHTFSNAPKQMARVPGGEYGLHSWDRPTDVRVPLNDYYIDKFEVSNREYKEFIDAGGYVHPGEPAMQEFKDRTGLPGPRNWRSGTYPENMGDYPVTGINWYEAAAYARFRGKRLPTIFEWEKAARDDLRMFRGMIAPWGLLQGDVLALRANFESAGAAPVSTFPFGMSPYGAYHMGDNVKEWCLNGYSNGFITAGGSWNDPPYRFGSYGSSPALWTSDTLGFRCVRPVTAETGQPAGAIRFDAKLKPPVYTPSSPQHFQAILRHYRYDRAPLNARVVSEQDLPDWRQLTIAYDGAVNSRVAALLCLPKNTVKPFQVIHYVAGSAFGGVPWVTFLSTRLAPHVRAGRAVFLVSVEGHAERPWPAGHQKPDESSVKFRDQLVRWTTDFRRGFDYLETRDDIDKTRIALWNTSSYVGPILAAVEDRYRSVVLMSGGFMGGSASIAEANVLNFAAHIRAPKLQLVGRYDEGHRFLLGTQPAYNLLSEPKRQVVYDGGHLPPIETSVTVVNGWLDETMGKVGR